MEKVKVTAKQAAEIEHYKQKGEEQVDYLIDIHSLNKRPDLAIAKMKPSQLVRALHFGYEVEPEYKEKDWVVFDGEVVQIKTIFINNTAHTPYLKNFSVEGINRWFDLERIERHATPEEIAEEKERRWWKKHGRDVWELRKGDVLREELSGLLFIVEYTENNSIVHFEDTDFDDYENVRNDYKIICFAEQRLDREGGE